MSLLLFLIALSAPSPVSAVDTSSTLVARCQAEGKILDVFRQTADGKLQVVVKKEGLRDTMVPAEFTKSTDGRDVLHFQKAWGVSDVTVDRCDKAFSPPFTQDDIFYFNACIYFVSNGAVLDLDKYPIEEIVKRGDAFSFMMKLRCYPAEKGNPNSVCAKVEFPDEQIPVSPDKPCSL